MTLQNRTASRRSVSEDTAERALRDLDDRHFTEVMLRELRRRRTFARVADQVDGALRAARFPIGDPFRPPADPAAAARRKMIASAVHSAVLQVPHACSTEACEILIERGVVPGSTPADALRTFARDGRLIVLRGDRRWVYPRFQLDHLVSLGAEPAGPGSAVDLDVGDHRALVAGVRGGDPSASAPE